MKNKKIDQEYSFDLRPASIEEAGLFYSNDEQDEALGTVGHLRLDFGHGFLPLRSTCYPHNDDQFDTLEFKMLLREFLEVLQENGPLASLSSMEAYCQKHGGASKLSLLYIRGTDHATAIRENSLSIPLAFFRFS